jgi:hypothetical protein
MKDNWKQFLSTQGAIIEGGQVLHFGNEKTEKQAALDGHILCDLSHYGLIRAYGEEAESFLQNQFCNDVRNVTGNSSQLSAYCNPKGRALAFFRLFLTNNQYYLRLPEELLADTLNRLRMFVLMSKVNLEDASDDLVRIGFSGPEAGQRLSKVVGNIPDENNAVSHADNLTLIKVSDTPDRFEIYGSFDSVKPVWETLAANTIPAGKGSWELLEIHSAIPEVVTETKEAFVPQMINLQAIDALSFKKGCYPGQEIVARMHYLGKLKRHMFLAHINEDVIPVPGDSLFAEDSGSGQGAGKVVRAQANPDGGTDLLAVVELASKDKGALRLHDTQGPVLNFISLPYSIESAE